MDEFVVIIVWQHFAVHWKLALN